MLTRSILLHLARESESDHRVHETVVSSAMETIFRDTALLMSHHAKAMARKANRASHCPRSAGKGKSKEGKGDVPSEGKNTEVPRVPKVRTKVRGRKLVCLVWKTPKSEISQETQKRHRRITLIILTLTVLGLTMAGVITHGLLT